MKTAFLFPGQGAQKISMGKDFYTSYATFRNFFDHASDVLGINLKDLCFTENDDINKTEYTQCAILSVSLGILKLLNENGIQASCSAGYSLGEYASLVQSGVMSEDDALRVIKERGKLMNRESGSGKGGMAAIIGLSNKDVEDTLKGLDNIGIANYNYDGQVTISGEIESVKKAAELLKEKGARRAVLLNVSGPFHSPLLKKAGEDLLKGVLSEVQINKPCLPYIPNLTGKFIEDNDDIRSLLARQVYSPVRWSDSMDTLIKNGYDTFIEVGPGHVLSGFLKKRKENITVLSSDTVEEYKVCIGGKL